MRKALRVAASGIKCLIKDAISWLKKGFAMLYDSAWVNLC